MAERVNALLAWSRMEYGISMRTWVRIPNDFFYNFTVCFLVYVRSSSNHKWFYSNFCILLFLNHLKACIFLIILILFNFGIITKIFTIKRHNITTTCTLLVSRPSSRAVWRTSVSSNFNEVHWFESNVIFFLLNCSVRFDCLFVCLFLSFLVSLFLCFFVFYQCSTTVCNCINGECMRVGLNIL